MSGGQNEIVPLAQQSQQPEGQFHLTASRRLALPQSRQRWVPQLA